ncbi:MAG: amidohydrolase family protein [Blastocatellia bacterium]|nr:amidohydrolase family protein [Blastocatellia bacterium]MCS7156125.1 amidohydrolase family protein [Blastocatellia bacterium]MDW8169237.1 amidohydrolase family protein [Acidobacteriota bacterium]MDW8256097.1 amidohydrolase family protein [Acidobacteriota bacterium]
MKGAIDVWCNPFTPSGIKHLFLDNEEVYFMMGIQWGRAANMKGYEPREFIAMMDRLGIEKVCVPALKQAFYRKNKMGADFSYEEIAELVRAYPGRIVGLAGINPFERMAGVRRLEYAVREYGFRGAHIHPYGFGLPLNAAEWYPFYAKCAELDIPIVIQTGHSAEFMPSACGRPILLDDVALYFPELRLVAAHTGWPWVEELIALAWKHPNVYIAVSGHAPRYWDKSLVHFLNSRGIGKVMWGTDYPLILHEESLTQIEQLGLKPEAKQALLRDTAVKVFKFEE